MTEEIQIAPGQTGRPTEEVKELLLKDYDYLSDSFWKNEQVGETRVNLYIGFVTFVLGALGALLTSKDTMLGANELQLILLGSLFSLFVLGTVTFFRILVRNSRSDGYKKGMNNVRLFFKEQNPSELHGYSPFGDTGYISPEKKKRAESKKSAMFYEIKAAMKGYGKGIAPRKFGGLAHTVAAINSIILAMLVVACWFPVDEMPSRAAIKIEGETTQVEKKQRLSIDPELREELIRQAAVLFTCSFLLHVLYARRRDLISKNKLKENSYTHAGGVVVRNNKGTPEVLLVESSEKKEWVLPKGKIEGKEGVIEAALREVKEEGGVFCRVLQPLGHLHYKRNGKEIRTRMYLMKALFDTDTLELRNKAWKTMDDAITEEGVLHPEARELITLARVLLG